MAMTYYLYRPTVIHALALKPTKDQKEDMIDNILSNLEEDEELLRDPNISMLVIRTEIGLKEDEEKTDWRNVTPSDIEEALKRAKQRGKDEISRLALKRANYSVMDRFSIISGGASRDYWTEPQVDMDAFRVAAGGGGSIADMTSTIRVESFNEDMFNSPTMLGNSFSLHKTSFNVFAFPSPSKKRSESDMSIPRTYLLEYEVGTERAFGEKEEGLNPGMLRDIVNTLFRFLGLHRYFITLYQDDFNKFQRSSGETRESIQKLHKKINALLKGKATSIKGSREKGKGKGGEDGGEVALLHSASVSFTQLMELDEGLSNTLIVLNDSVTVVERMEAELDTKKISMTGGASLVINSLTQHLQSHRDTIVFGFTNLRENIENSQTRLRNSVDSFKTYQENRRRATSERSEKTFNTVFILLAVLTIGDAVGNFLVYAKESDDILGAVLGLTGIFVALGIVFGIVYMLLLRDMFKDT